MGDRFPQRPVPSFVFFFFPKDERDVQYNKERFCFFFF